MDVVEPGVRWQALLDRLPQFTRRRSLFEPQMHRSRRRRADGQQEVLALVADSSDDQHAERPWWVSDTWRMAKRFDKAEAGSKIDRNTSPFCRTFAWLP